MCTYLYQCLCDCVSVYVSDASVHVFVCLCVYISLCVLYERKGEPSTNVTLAIALGLRGERTVRI